MSHFEEVDIKVAKSPSRDLAGRFKTGDPFTIFDDKFIFSKNANAWEEALTGSGTATHNSDQSLMDLEVTTTSGDEAIYQTYRYHAYVPGKAMEITQTAIWGAGQANTRTRMGYFDVRDGLYWEMDGTTFYVAHRTFTSGSAVSTRIAQSSWNFDKMDGTGVSGKTIDLTKFLIFQIEFLWLGGGDVRWSVQIDGDWHVVHEIHNSNTLSLPFMSTPTLPLRYEITNTDTAAGAYTYKFVCATVISNGGYTLPGFEFSAESAFLQALVATTRTPILAFRLKASFNSKPNRRTARLLFNHLFGTSATIKFEVAHLHNPSGIAGGTWVDVGGGSAVEYNIGLTAITGNPEHVIARSVLPTDNKGILEDIPIADISSRHSFLSQNIASDNSQVFVLYATTLSGAGSAWGSYTFVEFD